jgi:hypothetical protein
MKDFIIDRIENNIVVVINGEKELHIPLEKFKEKVKEGDVVNLENYTVLKKETLEKRQKIYSLLKRIFKN